MKGTTGALLSLVWTLGVVGCRGDDSGGPPAVASFPATAGLIVPLYASPGASWDRLENVKTSHPTVPIVALVNVNSGPGPAPSAAYASAIAGLKAAGITVIGYVFTDSAARSEAAVRAEIDRWTSWYGVDGVFLAGMKKTAGAEAYYAALTTYARSKGLALTVGDPEGDTVPSYVGTVDTIVIYQNSGAPSPSQLGGWHSNYARSNWSFIAFNVPALDVSYVKSVSDKVAYLYLTDDGLPNPWDTLPGYLENLAATLAGKEIATAPPPPPPADTGVMVPLYTYPGATWSQMIAAKNAHPGVPMIAIVNPSNGPGGGLDTNYLNGIDAMRAAGIQVLGYVFTQYGNRNPSDIRADIDRWAAWYAIDGIFFDEMANWSGLETWYQALHQHAKAKGYSITVGNPGADSSPSYVGTMDNIIIYESPGAPNEGYLGGWHSNFDKSNWSIIPFAISSLDPAYVRMAKNYVGWIYLTNDTLPNPWDSLPPYFESLIQALE